MAGTRRRYTTDEKSQILSEIEGGKSVAQVAEERGISSATIRQWTNKKTSKATSTASPTVTIEAIKAELAKYDAKIEALQSQIKEVEKAKQKYKDNLKAIVDSIN